MINLAYVKVKVNVCDNGFFYAQFRCRVPFQHTLYPSSESLYGLYVSKSKGPSRSALGPAPPPALTSRLPTCHCAD
eukprot:3834846-Prymnesium_polylepis.1